MNDEPMTDIERMSALAFLVGSMWGTLLAVRQSGQISVNAQNIIDDRLEFSQPLINKIYRDGYTRGENIVADETRAQD